MHADASFAIGTCLSVALLIDAGFVTTVDTILVALSRSVFTPKRFTLKYLMR